MVLPGNSEPAPGRILFSQGCYWMSRGLLGALDEPAKPARLRFATGCVDMQTGSRGRKYYVR
jgi:hypothetical protein